MVKKIYLILVVLIIIASSVVIYGFSIALSNNSGNESITVNNTANINDTINESAKTTVNDNVDKITNAGDKNKESTSSNQEDDPFSTYSEDVQAQARHYKNTHNHYSDDDNIVAHEYLSDGNARVYYGDGRSQVLPTG
ncbi:hypothetical protein [uncultured Methanobrevibacter sp.]|uniref:hypothetical protein n=1 Tax=uncultured Methanobrevibacter sp. TaxID=253161 RepID=UPI00261DE830|nr:hypothetical protein [uncultured Methanobrevibacter sp.]